MFDSLDEQIKHDAQLETSKAQRLLRWAIAIVVTFLVLGTLYLGVRLLE